MAKLTFSWTLNGEEAKPSKRDVENLKEQNYVFQLDFLRDVIFEAQKLYDETQEASRAYWEARRLEKLNGSPTAH
jgi:hypothetical protein